MRFKVVIIHSDAESANVAADRFTAYGCNAIAIGHSAEDAFVLCRSCQPDVLVMEPYMGGIPCDEVTAKLERDIRRPLIKIVLSPGLNPSIANRFYNCGGDLFLRAPYDFGHCVDQMKKYLILRGRQGTAIYPEPLIRGCARKILLRMRMPMTIHGFVYLLDAAELVYHNPDLLKNLVYGLYTEIGVLRQTPYANIERCIRTCIEKAFELGDLEFIYQHFGHKVRTKTGKPTNGDFISILVKMVQEDLNSATSQK